MPRRALAQKRPLLLASIAAALAFYYLRVGPLPELYLVPLKGSAVGLLALYCFVRHSSPDARLLGWAFGAAALGDMALEVDRTIGGTLFFLHHVLALGVYLRHRPERLRKADSWIVGLTIILVPLAGYLLPFDRTQAMQTTLYALALGAMAAGAWASTFPRYRVGAGAMLFVLSDLLLFAEMGPLGGTQWPGILVWPIYYLAQLLICTGVIQTLGKRDPELKLVSSR
jgi:uncharacterized membrane protein YhhN